MDGWHILTGSPEPSGQRGRKRPWVKPRYSGLPLSDCRPWDRLRNELRLRVL